MPDQEIDVSRLSQRNQLTRGELIFFALLVLVVAMLMFSILRKAPQDAAPLVRRISLPRVHVPAILRPAPAAPAPRPWETVTVETDPTGTFEENGLDPEAANDHIEEEPVNG